MNKISTTFLAFLLVTGQTLASAPATVVIPATTSKLHIAKRAVAGVLSTAGIVLLFQAHKKNRVIGNKHILTDLARLFAALPTYYALTGHAPDAKQLNKILVGIR